MEFRDFMKNNIVLFDGAMGTQIQQLKIPAYYSPDEYSVRMPEQVEKIHLDYLLSGADVITSNSFGANAYKCSGKEISFEKIIEAAISCARNAREKYLSENPFRPIYIAQDIGPIGALLKPSGHLEWDEAYDLYKAQAILGEKLDADIFLIETQTDLRELKCAILACKENSSLPIICTMSFEKNCRTFTGTDALSMVTTLENLGVEAVGFNCSFGSQSMRPLVEKILQNTNLPVLVQPNMSTDGEEEESVDDFIANMQFFVELGVGLIGGCCGTTPEVIARLHQMRKRSKSLRKPVAIPTRICSYAQTVEIGNRPKIIGERINPSNKKILQEELRLGRFDFALKEAVLQTREGADILDVNVGTSFANESELLPALVQEIQGILDIPLQIDSSSAAAIEKAVRIYNGKPLINSVTGKEESLEAILPIAKKYGACVLGLAFDEDGIPETVEGRMKVARKILERATAIGIPRENVLLDALTLTISSDSQNAKLTTQTLRRIKEELGLCTVLGVSNISFGLPNRPAVNRAFLISALENGLDLPIINTADSALVELVDSHLLLSGNEHAKQYIEKYKSQNERTVLKSSERLTLEQTILGGMDSEVLAIIDDLLREKQAIDIVDEELIPILNAVGEKFEKGEFFLPQLIQASQSVKVAFDKVKEKFAPKTDSNKGKILLATVEHDVHDIGKNIVKVVMENYGFDVIDLGKDVPAHRILEVCKERDIRLIGLSALMTTTVQSMEETIALLKKELPDCCIIAGGAVLSPRYAEKIGADAYAAHPSETVRLANAFYKKRAEKNR
ncbi:MAG: homocysteine S-methyltransferase family protein [Peptostreptococcaceae bacterium]|nr:homocysteine S-methyltransferase family protein [Peptostreptococcaceae bacterium]